jgi:hypothetical protein
MLSLLVAVISEWFLLEEGKLTALFAVGENKLAARAVTRALKYNVMRRKRYRMLEDGDRTDHVPSSAEINFAKNLMESALADFIDEKKSNVNLDSNYKRDREFDLVRNEVLELSDKFDYFILTMLKSGFI